jgi:hypothetical protein
MATSSIRPANRRYENLFFSVMAGLILVTVFVGFSRTYYLAGVFRAPLPDLLVHIHGAVFSTWIILLIVQTSFVSAGRVDIHRRLGLYVFGWACLMVTLGVLAATDEMARKFAPGDAGVATRAFYAIPLGDMLVFATLIFFAFRERIHPPVHKRLILISTVAILNAAVARWPITASWWSVGLAVITCYMLLLFLAVYDLWSTGKIQRVTLLASAYLIVVQQASLHIGTTAPWQSFAGAMQNLALSVRSHF